MKVLNREEMKNIMAGGNDPKELEPGEGSCYLTCGNCQNEVCQGYVSDCSIQSVWPMCGSHDTGWTCTCI